MPPGRASLPGLLARRRCIQVDPLDAIGTNADLVAMARIDGLRRGDVDGALLPGHAFEHFAKERCLLPAAALPWYRAQAVQTPWWRHSERMKRIAAVDPGAVEDVLAEVRERGPIAADRLADRGRVDPIDWSGWKGTPFVTKLALEVLWARLDVVVAGRGGRAKRYDVPERALPAVANVTPVGSFHRWALLERVEAAGLMTTSAGPLWGQLHDVRKALPAELIAEGLVEEVRLAGSRRRWLAPAGFVDRPWPAADDRMRILGPLDPMLWDRKLVELAFGFEYVWEVYKPRTKRRWGWYVCPLLHRGELVGRFEGQIVDGQVVADRVWREPGHDFDDAAFERALHRHSAGM